MADVTERSGSSSNGPRVAVIGAGVAGLSAAQHCARLGASAVTVLEKSTLAAGSSGLSAGIFNRQTFAPVDLTLRVESGRQLAALERATDFRVARCGYMRLARSEEEWAKVVETTSDGDYPDTRLLSPAEIARLVPGMRLDDVVGAMYGADDGHMDGPELCAAYLQVGRSNGVTYRGGTEVVGAARGPGGIRLETTQGDVEADVVINAAGPWLAQVGEILGAPVPIDNQLHEVALLEVPSLAGTPIPTVQTYFPGSGEDAVYVRPEGQGRFVAGLHSYESTSASVSPGSSSRHVSEDHLEKLAEALVDRFPDWEDASLESGWSGLYPLSPDGAFIIGPDAADPRVVSLGGLGGVGLTVSPAAGMIAAEWAVFGESRTFDFASDLLPSRFGDAGRR